MRAVVSHRSGPPESLVLQDVPLPRPGPLQVRVRVLAAAVNFPDVLLVADGYQVALPRPFIPGSELAGDITAVGADVADLQIGDRVVATTMTGAFAEEAVIDASSVLALPTDIDPAVAAGFLVAYTTAFHALTTTASLRDGEVVLVLGAAGGVGLAAVELAAGLGARVVAAASSADKLAACTHAEVLIDYGTQDLRTALKDLGGVDVVIDPVGGTLSETALRALRPGGRFVTLGYASGVIPAIPLNLVLLKRISILGFDLRSFTQTAPATVAATQTGLLERLAHGDLHPLVGTQFRLDQAAAALRQLADRKAVGKVVLLP